MSLITGASVLEGKEVGLSHIQLQAERDIPRKLMYMHKHCVCIHSTA